LAAVLSLGAISVAACAAASTSAAENANQNRPMKLETTTTSRKDRPEVHRKLGNLNQAGRRMTIAMTILAIAANHPIILKLIWRKQL